MMRWATFHSGDRSSPAPTLKRLKTVSATLVACALLSTTHSAQGVPVAFGKDESIQCIADVKLRGSSGEKLCIAYKTSTIYAGGPVWITDDGYVLGTKTDAKRYYKLPAASEIAALQGDELLPAPLPQYQLSKIEYVQGFGLWLGLIGVALLLLVTREPKEFSCRLSGAPKGAAGVNIGDQRIEPSGLIR
jgi:hypothetical protein